MDNLPLVSVPVVTYNSSKYVLETLESIKAQTYQNIELIVSDDSSTDDTVEICRKWIVENSNRFVRTELITSPTNTGISANLNRAEAACRGEWVKGIAGDDALCPNCVEELIKYVLKHPEAVFVFSKVSVFGSDEQKVSHFENDIFDYSFFELPKEEQYRWLIGKSFQPIPAATTFYNRTQAISLGLNRCDERIPMLDDWPKWIKALESGVTFHFVDKPLVRYRISDSSVCSSVKYSKVFFHSLRQLFWLYQVKPLIRLFGLRYAAYRYSEIESVTGLLFWRVMKRLLR